MTTAAAGDAWGKALRETRRLLARYVPSEAQRVFGLTILIGLLCGFAAVAFHLSIRFAERELIDRAMSAGPGSWIAWTLVTPTLGGLAAGLLLLIVPRAAGSGVPQVKEAYAAGGGRIRLRDSIGKFVIGVVQIGSGASLGREGPTVQICAGVTSLLGRLTSLPKESVRRLLPVGVAAGIAAAFNAPIAAVTFTIEEIVGNLDQTVLSGVVVAAALAAVIERSVLGTQPVFEVSRAYGLEHASSLFFYAGLGLAAAAVSVTFTDSLLALRAWFKRFHGLPRWSHPALGGLVTGGLAVLALFFLKSKGVTGGGYDTLSKALLGQIGLRVLLALGAMKLIATVACYSSGGAGGIFAPALFIGGMLGGAVGFVDLSLMGQGDSELGAFALVGMGAVFAGIIRAPITSVLIIFEMTGGYGLILPLMIANMTAYGLARHWRPVPIYEALLEQDGVMIPRVGSSATGTLDKVPVADAMTRDPVRVLSGATLAEAQAFTATARFSSVPVVDESSRFLGMLSLAELREASDGGQGVRPARELIRSTECVASDDPLLSAVVAMSRAGVRQLGVVAADDSGRLVGILAMSDVFRAQARAAEGPGHA